MTDPIADMLTRIRNAQKAGHPEVRLPFSRLKLEMVKVLNREGRIGAYRTEADGAKSILVSLRYGEKKVPVVTHISRASRPGRRVYVGYEDIPVVRSGIGLVILSTSKGLMTGHQAKKEKVGGEILCTLW